MLVAPLTRSSLISLVWHVWFTFSWRIACAYICLYAHDVQRDLFWGVRILGRIEYCLLMVCHDTYFPKASLCYSGYSPKFCLGLLGSSIKDSTDSTDRSYRFLMAALHTILQIRSMHYHHRFVLFLRKMFPSLKDTRLWKDFLQDRFLCCLGLELRSRVRREKDHPRPQTQK